MRKQFNTQPEAQSLCDRLHTWMINEYPWYSESVNKGETVAYAKPYQDTDLQGKPINTYWYVNIKDRVLNGLTAKEKQELV